MNLFISTSALTILALFSHPPLASYKCEDASGSTQISISLDQHSGTLARVQSNEITNYYSDQHKINIKHLETVIDPESNKAIHEVSGTGHHFMLYAPASGTDAVWGLEISLPAEPAFNTIAAVTDMESKRFQFKLRCQKVTGAE